MILFLDFVQILIVLQFLIIMFQLQQRIAECTKVTNRSKFSSTRNRILQTNTNAERITLRPAISETCLSTSSDTNSVSNF